MTDWLTDWLAGWLAGWLTVWLAGWLADCLAGWLADCLAGWLTVWLAGWLTGWLAGWQAGWLTEGGTDWLTDQPTGWLPRYWVFRLACSLIDWLAGLFTYGKSARLANQLTYQPTGWLACRLTGWLADFLTSRRIVCSDIVVFIHAFLCHVLIPSAYTKCKDGQLSWNNVLFFFATGVLNCKISVTSEFIYKNCNETMDVVVDSSRNVYLPLWENTSRSWNQSYGRICRVPPADALREK